MGVEVQMRGDGRRPDEKLRGDRWRPDEKLQGDGRRPDEKLRGDGRRPDEKLQGNGRRPDEKLRGDGRRPDGKLRGDGRRPDEKSAVPQRSRILLMDKATANVMGLLKTSPPHPSSPPYSHSPSLPSLSAVLQHSRILLMDEATANMDRATDTLIQSTIRRHFTTSTVITIAHRLHSIIDAHKVGVSLCLA
ncbi:unnamed protein product [Closterium sp. Naga37s-1]|nr:unnamed protein product [Closterium sp. Naga37s-1]